MSKTGRLAGHTLPNEGRIRDERSGYLVNCCGPIQCSCGEWSPFLSGTPARKRWHRDHKDAVREAMADDQG